MTRPLATTALLSSALLAPVSGTPTGASSDTPLQIADLAWERGDYPAALSAYLRLLDSADAASVLEPIALRTGELYADDGADARRRGPAVLARWPSSALRDRPGRHAASPA